MPGMTFRMEEYTRSAAPVRYTDLLTMWNYEEYWHGEALAAVLAAHGVETGGEHVRALRLGRAAATGSRRSGRPCSPRRSATTSSRCT